MSSPKSRILGPVLDRTNDLNKQWSYVRSEDSNMLVKLEWPGLKRKFFEYLQAHTDEIRKAVSYHLRSSQPCRIADESQWLCGSFNVCIPVYLGSQKLAFRCPLPHRLGGSQNTGLLDEKLRCEAATFAWISYNCPRVPIPQLWGLGLPNGETFTPVVQLPWYKRIFKFFGQAWAWMLRRPFCRPFSPCARRSSIECGYLLMDFVEKGRMLSAVGLPRTIEHKHNLYRSISRIMLDMAKPLPAIGSFTINNSGEMSLTNRPLTWPLAVLENAGIPVHIAQNRCYATTDSYLHDLLQCHDMKFLYQPNSVRSKNDAEGQMAVLAIMRSLIFPLTQPNLRSGPFVFRLTDSHQSNLFVDSQYNVVSMVDLEWACSLPAETLSPPHWLSGHGIDDLGQPENKEDYYDMSQEFLAIYEEEDTTGFLSPIMGTALRKHTQWLWLCLNNFRTMGDVFMDHLQPVFAPLQLDGQAAIDFQIITAPYFSTDASHIIERKVDDLKTYQTQLKFRFDACEA